MSYIIIAALLLVLVCLTIVLVYPKRVPWREAQPPPRPEGWPQDRAMGPRASARAPAARCYGATALRRWRRHEYRAPGVILANYLALPAISVIGARRVVGNELSRERGRLGLRGSVFGGIRQARRHLEPDPSLCPPFLGPSRSLPE